MQLRKYIQTQAEQDGVVEIYSKVKADVELSSLVYRSYSVKNPQLMRFHHVAETFCSVVANLFCSEAKLRSMLSLKGQTLETRLDSLPPYITSWDDFCVYIHEKYAFASTPYACDDNAYIELDSLFSLPQVRYWEGDSRAYYSLASLFMRERASEVINAGIYRLSVFDSRLLTVNWRNGSRAHATWRQFADRGEKMPVTVAMGVDPALTFASLFPLPHTCSEITFWSFIRGQQQFCRLNTAGLPLPHHAEILLEGYVDPYYQVEEGTFANHTGFYTNSALCPVMYIERILSRIDAVVPITVVGPPPTENALLGVHVWELLFVLLKREFPFIRDFVCPAQTAYLPVLILQIVTPPSHNEWNCWRELLLNNDLLKRSHTLILVDETTDISDYRQIFWHCMNQESTCCTYLHGGMRLIDGVCWRFMGKVKVCVPRTIK